MRTMDVHSGCGRGRVPGIRAFRLAVVMALLLGAAVIGQMALVPDTDADPAAPVDEARITVRLVPSDAPDQAVHTRESLVQVMSGVTLDIDPQDRSRAAQPPAPLGYRATLWVRGAHVSETHTFERHYQGKYISRSGELPIARDALGVGEHVIEPGGHRFTLDDAGRLTSADPDIRIEGDTVNLTVYGIDILPVRAGQAGPVDQRLVPEDLGLFLPPPADDPEGRRVNLLSHTRTFYPLRIYLPANTAREGYVLEPYGQTFHVHPGGRVELTGDVLPGMRAEDTRILADYATFQVRVGTTTALGAAIGSAAVPRGPAHLSRPLEVRPSRRALRFTAGFGAPSGTFGLLIDPDLTQRPQKAFLADNRASHPHVVRLVGLEWDEDVFEVGRQTAVNLRFAENAHEILERDIVAPPPADDAADDAAVETGIERLHALLREHANAAPAAPASHPLSAIMRHVSAETLELPHGGMVDELLGALNAVLHDPHFYHAEGFADIPLSAAARAAVAAGIPDMDTEARLRANRALLADVFPGLLSAEPREPSIARPVARAEWSPYEPGIPIKRVWTPFPIDAWHQGDGRLTFNVPDLPAGFYALRFRVEDETATKPTANDLGVELFTALVSPGQTGTAAFVSPKGRDAFVTGEAVRLEAVVRSRDPARPAASPAIVLKHPDGRAERLPFTDRGGAWSAQPFVLDGAVTRHLPAGRYELTFDNLPDGIHPWAFAFDLVGTDPRSLYTIVRPSKYDGPMNQLVASWFGGYADTDDSGPIDLDRAVRTIAGQGYNRIELMTYIEDHHRRVYTDRERLAARDHRLPPPEAVYQPSPRDRILNACVRHGLQFADVWLSYNDFHLPLRIEPYIKASERWIQREVAAMRHSPAFDGIILYDEMYEWGLIGTPDWHTELWPRLRDQAAEAHMGERPSAIRSRWSRELRRPRRERDPEARERYLELRKFMIGGWGDFNSRVARAAREIAPRARIMTYNQGFLQVTAGLGAVSSGIDMDAGFRPDVFRDLDIRNIIHYHDFGVGWLHSPMLVPLLRFAPRRPVWINFPIRMGYLKHNDGQFQRRMAFAFLSEGADGISLWGLEQTFGDGRNPVMMHGKEATSHLNREILAPLGELVTATEPGYRRVGIVHTFNQMALSDFKELRTANQIEEIWIACWRLGYPAVFLRECAFEQPLDDLDVIFVPGIRFDGELDDQAMRRLADAIARGARVVVERGSTLDLEGITRLDFDFNNYFLGPGYNPHSADDETYRIFRYTQPTVDFLANLLPQWTQPSASGPFTVGPNWRRGGEIEYLIMANYEFVDYTADLKSVTARPARIPLAVSRKRGNVAYDLLHGTRLPLDQDAEHSRLVVDMSTIQGAMLAFLPDVVGGLDVDVETAADGSMVRVRAVLKGASGQAIDGVFPARITLAAPGMEPSHYDRALGLDRAVELRLPGGAGAMTWSITVRENLSGYTAVAEVSRPAVEQQVLRPLSIEQAYVPYPDEVERFLKTNSDITLVVGERSPELEPVAEAMAEALRARGLRVTRKAEREAIRYPEARAGADHNWPPDDGYHTWRHPHSIGQIKPLTLVDGPLILLTAASGSRLLYALEECGYFCVPSIGDVGLPVQPTVQVARRALNVDADVLCLIANDAATMAHAVAAALGGDAASPAPPPSIEHFMPAATAVGDSVDPIAPASERVGNNELVTDIKFDAEGNSYITTWGHGDNLYSLAPDGAVRFSHYLTEIGPLNLTIGDDRLTAYTVSGARLFQVGLDGRPLWQARLPMSAGTGDTPRRYWAVHRYAPATRLVVFRDDMNQTMRVIDHSGTVTAEWQGEEVEETDDEAGRRGLHDFAVAADGKRLAQVESTHYFGEIGRERGSAYDSYLVVRDMMGRKLHERYIANEPGRVTAEVRWHAGDEGPSLVHEGSIIRLSADLTNEIDKRRLPATGAFDFDERGALVRIDSRTLAWVDRDGRERARLATFETFPSVAALSADDAWFAFLDEYGRATLIDAATGQARVTFTVPELGTVMRFTPDSRRLLIGGLRESVQCFDLDGRLVWRTALGPHNRTLAELPPLKQVKGYPRLTTPPNPAFPDRTDAHWPPLVDEPGQLDERVTLDANRMVDAAAGNDAAAGWSSAGDVQFVTPGHEGGRGLLVGSNLVSQTVSGFIGDHFTWVLEFFYRARTAGDEGVRMTAGLRAISRYPSIVVRQFEADDTWRFARVVTKSGMDAEALAVGLRAEGGEALVDGVSLRRIRFPSVNHLLYPPVHEITPRVLATPRFIETYDPLGRLREAIPNRIIIENLRTISFNLVEAGFLQNGRLNDVGSDWHISPLGGATTDISIGLREPRWISTAGVYFNAYDEENIAPHYDILVSDLNTRQTHRVAAVRNNRQIFQLSTFEPRLTDEVIVRLVNARMHQRTVTEIEVYGPLSGREGPAAFVDPDGHNTYMGNFSRVDRRPLVLGRDFRGDGQGNAMTQIASHPLPIWQYPVTPALLGESRLHVGRAIGYVQSHALEEGIDAGVARANSLGFGNPGALFGGLWLLPGNDGILYGIDPISSRTLWSVPLGIRLRSGPVAVGNDVIAASDTGRLVAIDLGSGALLRETELSGGVAGSLATDGERVVFLSEDGLLQCIDGDSFASRWTVPVAEWSESTPAIADAIVYSADRLGVVRAVRMQDGTVLWSTRLDEEFTRCPVIVDDTIYLGCRHGKLVAMDRRDGTVNWETRVNTRFSYEPLPVELAFHEAEKNERVWAGDFKAMNTLPDAFEPLFTPDPVAGTIVVTPASAGMVTVTNGALRLDGRAGPDGRAGQLMWRLREKVGEDVRVTATLENMTGSAMLTLGGDALTGYRVVVDMRNRVVSLDTVTGGAWRERVRAAQPLPADASAYHVRAEKIGATIRVFINDDRVLEYVDTDPPGGPDRQTVSVGTFTDTCVIRDLTIERIIRPERSWRKSSLLVFDRQTAMVVDPENGTMQAWEVNVHDRNRVEKATVALPDLPLASIAHYRGALYAVVRSMNLGQPGLVFGGPLHQHHTGGVLRLTPLETEDKQ